MPNSTPCITYALKADVVKNKNPRKGTETEAIQQSKSISKNSKTKAMVEDIIKNIRDR